MSKSCVFKIGLRALRRSTDYSHSDSELQTEKKPVTLKYLDNTSAICGTDYERYIYKIKNHNSLMQFISLDIPPNLHARYGDI